MQFQSWIFFALRPVSFFPPISDDGGVDGRLFHEEASTLHLGGGDQSRAATAEWFKNESIALGQDLDVRDEELNRLRTEDNLLSGRLFLSAAMWLIKSVGQIFFPFS